MPRATRPRELKPKLGIAPRSPDYETGVLLLDYEGRRKAEDSHLTPEGATRFPDGAEHLTRFTFQVVAGTPS